MRLLISYRPGAFTPAINLAASTAALGEDLPGEGSVADLHDLVVAGKDDLVLPHDGAAPDRGDADLLLVTGMADAVALEDVLRLVAAGPRRRVGVIRAVPLGASTFRR